MPLILAIDPDKRQSSQLASLVKTQLQAELVHRGTAVEALDALKGRVPDLVLTSPLISPREDAALAVHLRDLGAAAAHVQTITIPLLGSAAPQPARGVLAALRRDKPQTAMTDGCAPDVFAEQIRQYLRTADEQKAGAAVLAVTAAAAVVAEAIGIEAAPVPEPELVAIADLPVEPEALAVLAASDDASWDEPASEPSAPEPAALRETEPVALDAEEPARLPLSQLLRLVSDWTTSSPAPSATPEADPLAAIAPGPQNVADAVEPIAMAAAPVAELDLDLDPVAAQALEELSRQLPAASLADGIPAETPVPVVEMRTFETLDTIASQLAAAPLPKHDSLDDLASLFAATPTPRHAEPLTSGFDVPAPGRRHEFESLFAAPSAGTDSVAPIEVPGVDPSLFASNAAQPPSADPPPFESLLVPADRDAVAALEPIVSAPVPVEPLLPEVVVAESFIREPAPVECGWAPSVLADPLQDPLTPVLAEPVLAAAALVEPPLEHALAETALPELEVLEPAAAEWQTEATVDRAWAPAAPQPFEEEIALDVDAFDDAVTAPAAQPAPPADTSFSFRFVDGFGDTWSDFDVPSVAAVAADFGLAPMAPTEVEPAATPSSTEWFAAAAAPAAVPAPELAAAPVLDDEALSLIGEAAHKASLDAFVIEEFERGVRRGARKPKKAHAGATHVAPAAPPAAKKKGPVQDEWGLFDPEQCGFAALEEEDPAERRKARDGTRVRVISY